MILQVVFRGIDGAPVFHGRARLLRRRIQIPELVIGLHQSRLRGLLTALDVGQQALRATRLNFQDHGARQQQHQRRRDRADRHRVPPDKLRGAIPERIAARHHRPAFQEPPDVLGELLDGRISPHRLFSERLQNNHVEVA